MANEAQKAQLGKVNLEEMENLQEEMVEMAAEQQEMQEVLTRDYGLDTYDEAELAEELNELDAAVVKEKLAGSSEVPSYIPQKAQASVKRDSEILAHLMDH